MVDVKELNKNFSQFKAVNNLNLRIKKGRSFGLLGPNGAGKSTLIGMLYGAVLRSSGQLNVFGLDPSTQSREIKKRMGVVTQDNALDESLTVLENMMLYSAFIGVPKNQRLKQITELLDYMNLSHKINSSIQTLSGGMKRRLVFVRALLGKPELLILDEPTTGLDPAVRQLLWGKVRELHKSGTTIIITTHYMHEAEVLCDELVILNHGQIISQGSPQQLIEKHTPGFVGIFHLHDKETMENIKENEMIIDYHQDASGIYIRTSQLVDLMDFTTKYNLKPLQIRPSTLEDVFLKLTGQELSTNA